MENHVVELKATERLFGRKLVGWSQIMVVGWSQTLHSLALVLDGEVRVSFIYFLLPGFSSVVCVLSRFSRVQLFATLWTIAHQAPLSRGILQARMWAWVAISLSRGSSPLRDQTPVSCFAGRFFINWATREGLWLNLPAIKKA